MMWGNGEQNEVFEEQPVQDQAFSFFIFLMLFSKSCGVVAH